MWISPDGSNGIIVRTASATNGFGIGIMNGAVLAGAGSSGGQPAMAPNPLPTNTWSHIAVVVGSGQVNLYVNGAFVQSAAGTIASSTDDWNVGGSSPFGNFSGAIDDLRIYDAALTDGQVALVAQ